MGAAVVGARVLPLRVVLALLAAFVASMLAVAPGMAHAQSGDLEMSCAPDTVTAGGRTVCRVAGVPASTRTVIEVRDGDTVVAQSSAISRTDGRATIDVDIPADSRPGPVPLVLRGTTLTFTLTVSPGLPTGVSAGRSPSTADVERGFPLGPMLAVGLTMLALVSTGRRASAGRTGR
jgi:hypothetical protein